MRVIIEEDGIQKVIQIQEYVHYANVLSTLGNSTTETISQDGITKAIQQSQLINIYNNPGIVPEPEPEPDTADYYQDYLDYLALVQEDEDNRYPDIVVNPSYQDYLDYLGIDSESSEPESPEFPVFNNIINSGALGYMILSIDDLAIEPGLPIGFNFTVLSKSSNPIAISLPTGESLWEPSGINNSIEVLDKVQLVKITEDEWLRSDLLRLRFIE